MFVYNGGLNLDETGELVVARGPNVVLEVIDASAIAARGRPASSEAVAGHGAVHVELRPRGREASRRATSRPAREPPRRLSGECRDASIRL